MDSMLEILANNTVETIWLARQLEQNKKTNKTEQKCRSRPYIEGHWIWDIGYIEVLLGRECLFNK